MSAEESGAGTAVAILHVDMDAFFASVEALDDPRLVGIPLIVGGAGPRGVVASCSYEARAYGVRSAMPASVARRLCPMATFVAGHYDRYVEESKALHEICSRYTPLVEGIALDEAFMDVSGAASLLGRPTDLAWDLRGTVQRELGLSCSVGVARTKLMAKLASEEAKPVAGAGGVAPGYGVVRVGPDEETEFLRRLPVRALWGIGPVTGRRLEGLGIRTVGELADLTPETLESSFGRAHGRHLFEVSHGIDDRRVEPARDVKSISQEETYPTDRYDSGVLHEEVLRLSDGVASRLRRDGMGGRTVTLKVRYGDFQTITRSKTLPAAVDSAREIARTAAESLSEIEAARGVRLLGIAVGSLRARSPEERCEQLLLDLDAACAGGLGREGARFVQNDGWSAAADAIETIRARFGEEAVGSAALATDSGIRLKRRGSSQWGPGSTQDGRGGQGGRQVPVPGDVPRQHHRPVTEAADEEG